MSVTSNYDDGEAYAEGDDKISWTRVEDLEDQVAKINAIENNKQRMEAAKRWQEELNG